MLLYFLQATYADSAQDQCERFMYDVFRKKVMRPNLLFVQSHSVCLKLQPSFFFFGNNFVATIYTIFSYNVVTSF